MPTDIQTSLDRIQLYLARVRIALNAGNRVQALADLAELAEIARRLWAAVAKQK